VTAAAAAAAVVKWQTWDHTVSVQLTDKWAKQLLRRAGWADVAGSSLHIHCGLLTLSALFDLVLMVDELISC
jgi:hypothetical protein